MIRAYLSRTALLLSVILSMAATAGAATGEIAPDDFRISDMGANGNTVIAARASDVAYNATNNLYLVVWDGDDVDNEFEIYGQLINAATRAEIGTDFRISEMGPDGQTAYGALSAAVVWNSVNNEFLVIWRGDDDTLPLIDNEFEVYGQRLNGATGAKIGTQFQISDMGPDGNTTFFAGDPAVAYDSTLNQYLVVWRGDDSVAPDKNEIYGQLLDASGGELGTNDFRISVTPGDTNRIAGTPHVAYNSTNQEYLVVWQADALATDNDTEVFGRRINASTGALLGASVIRISDMGPEDDANYRGANPRVAYNPISNEYLVIWIGNELYFDDFVFEIYGQRLAGANGTELGANDFRISDMGASDTDTLFDASRCDVAWSPAENRYLVVWHGDDAFDSEDEIWGQRLDATGAEVGENDVRLSTMGPDESNEFDAFNPRVAYGADGVTLIVWEGDDDRAPLVDNEREIFGQFFGGFPSGTTTTITANPTSIIANGTSTSTITVQAKDVAGADMTTGGATVVLMTSRGTLGPVTDHGNGTYTATLTSSVTAGTATITGSIDGSPIVDDATVELTPPAPTNVVATAVSASQVSLSWNVVSGATSYEIYRATVIPAYSFLASSMTAAYTDNAVSADQTYVYIVRALGSAGTSPFSGPDAATTVVFTDATLNNSVLIREIHLTEIRRAVNAMRAAAGLSPMAFSPVTAGTLIRATDITQAREALTDARTAIGLPVTAYTDPTITSGMTVKGVHFTQLRQRTQ